MALSAMVKLAKVESMLAPIVMNTFLKQNIQNIRQIAGIPSEYPFPS